MEIRIKIEGKLIQLDRLPLGLKYEAEKALGMGMSDNETASLLVPIAVALHLEDPERSWVQIADEVRRMDTFSMETVDDEEDGDDPLDVPASETNGTDHSIPPPTGTPDSDPSGSPLTLPTSPSSS